MTWENGRELATATSGNTSLAFTYDGDGIRTSKTVNGVEHKYYYSGGQLLRETYGSNILDFAYNADGSLYSFRVNGTYYYYVTNLQGDVIGIVDAEGATVASYEYDPYGDVISATGTLAEINPLRYRGYYYDAETGFYYLQSRYYDPEIGRFINADSYVSTGDDPLDFNMFAYCGNNPIMGYDPTGEINWGKLFSGAGLISVGLTACLVAATVVTGGACAPLMVMAGATFVAGGMTLANGTAEIIESTTGYNYMRDGVYRGDTRYYEGQKAFFVGFAEMGTVMLMTASSSPLNLCFVAGTLVLTATGTKAIELIEPGDYVWAWDEESGDVALKRVVETYVNETNELVHIFVNGEGIITTPSHPFYSPVKGWTEAVKLRAGDILVLVNGEYVVVEKVQHEILEAPVTVYNFQVKDYHTYYVANTGILVHNKCGGENSATKRGRQMHKDWDYGPGVATERVIAPGSRVDGIDTVNKIVYELKPNNPRAIRQGLKQLDRYLSILGESEWAGVLVLYD